jgi:hypothetical protein
MANIQLPTGKTIQISLYDFLFRINDDEVHLFFQSCIADDLGTFIEDPFANKAVLGKLEFEDDSLPEEIPLDEDALDKYDD